MTKKQVTVYIGRFNPFHLGHAHVLERALRAYELVIVLIGSSGQARSLKNPFTFAERQSMINYWYGDLDGDVGQLVAAPLRDHPYNDNAWIAEVQRQVNEIGSEQGYLGAQIHLTGSDRDESTWYLSAFPQWKLDMVHPYDTRPVGCTGDTSATSVREVLYTSELRQADFAALACKLPRSTSVFLQEFAMSGRLNELRAEYKFIQEYKLQFAGLKYPPIFSTADMVVIQSGHVLVTVRGHQPGLGLWALPGGFVKARQRVKDCAIDETVEETGIRLATGKRALDITKSMLRGSIRAMEIFDAIDRSARGRTITTAFLARLDDTKPLPTVKGMNAPLEDTGGKIEVETLDAFWLPLDLAIRESSRWFEDHHAIVEWGASVKS